MLSVTQSAAQMIAHLTDQAELPEGGLRIADEGPEPGLKMSVAPRPAADDLVVLQHHVAIYLDPIAAERLSTETLDARSNEGGAAFFLEP
ncbi:MAG: HesB/YadR/YfhF-family protein [Frankiales bacterium]|nr:HesB/YadR/YfhF-family protein [Frankiales bacterium]